VPASAEGRRVTELQYFAACVAIWSTTWIAITYQLGSVAPEISVAYRSSSPRSCSSHGA